MDNSEKKRVNIYPRRPITSTNPPIKSPMSGVVRTIKDIRKCIVAGAKVEEILPNGGRLLLNLTNYDLNNDDAAPTIATPAGHVERTDDSGASVVLASTGHQPAPRMSVRDLLAQKKAPETKSQESEKITEMKEASEANIKTAPELPATSGFMSPVDENGQLPPIPEGTITVASTSDEPVVVESTVPSDVASEEKAMVEQDANTNLTRRQRRAMARMEAEKAAQASEEKVETKDPE